jgi:hypothetical protein
MKTNLNKEGHTGKSTGIDTVTSEMVLERGTELAHLNGRSAQDVMHSDLHQAKLELTRNAASHQNEDCKP